MGFASPDAGRPRKPRRLEYAGGDRAEVDAEHLNLLSIFHYIVGGLTVLMSCMFIALVVIGMDKRDSETAQAASGIWWIIGGIVGMTLGWIFGGLLMLSGYFIQQKRARMFTLIMAALDLLQFPFGTLLSVVTFSVLSRDSIQILYGRKKK